MDTLGRFLHRKLYQEHEIFNLVRTFDKYCRGLRYKLSLLECTILPSRVYNYRLRTF